MAFQTVPRPSLARRYRQSGLWADQTFFSILAARADAHPGREAFADGAGRITYDEFKGFDYDIMANELRARLPSLRHIVVSGGEADPDAKVWSLEEGIATRTPLAAAERVAMSPNDIFRMAFTSGTTGDPKCVLHSFNTTLPAVHRLNADMKVTPGERAAHLPAPVPQRGLSVHGPVDRGGRAGGSDGALLGT